ncbi:MAG: hypothetical protein IIY38_07345 [Clostridia bacterium]|nr:hypothetical protein [Clostridia bacterium]
MIKFALRFDFKAKGSRRIEHGAALFFSEAVIIHDISISGQEVSFFICICETFDVCSIGLTDRQFFINDIGTIQFSFESGYCCEISDEFVDDLAHTTGKILKIDRADFR